MKRADLEKKWKIRLISILEELDAQQYRKTLSLLTKIPKGFKSGRTKEIMVQKIIEEYGLEKSILEIRKIMEIIPRRDCAIQDLLKPFKKITDKPPKKKKAQQRSKTSGERKTIRQLKSSGYLLDEEIIVVKVVKKSDLIPYTTQQGEKKIMFYLTVADTADCIKVVVYGRERFDSIREKSCYSFKNVIVGNVIKVTKRSIVLEDEAIKVPAHLEKEAQSLMYKRSHFATAETSAETRPGGDGGASAGVQSTAVQTERIKITKIIKSNKTYTHLEAEINRRQQKLMVTNRRLAKAFGFTPAEDFKEKLCSQMPLTAEVKMEMERIKSIKKI
ncbi:ribonuclease kappa-B isoform X1 [Channa argus]|uniref:ribonuclease kappa-B isoform X1 n=1 Tax=Channa argus TaxID=215402 RepID=UPI002944E13C|nr:hypothetical protein Q8A73_022808 [Channa argus]